MGTLFTDVVVLLQIGDNPDKGDLRQVVGKGVGTQHGNVGDEL